MRFAGILTVLLPLLLVLGAPPPCHGAGAAVTHNITDILAAYPNFTEFSAALTSTGAAAEINRHQTITVLAVDNAAMAQLKAQKLEPKDLERVAYLHALMDYLDADKLRNILGGSQETSLFQAVGKAQAGEGMVSISVSGGGRVAFSLSSGGGASAFFQKSIKEVPSDIAVLQVSAPIWSPAPVAAAPPPAPAPAALAPAPAPAAPGSSSSPAPAPATAPAHAPPPAPAPASSPAAADATTPALAPAAAPAIPPSPRRRPAPAPEADTPAASPDADTDSPADEQKSNGARDTASWSLGTAVAAAAPVIVLLLW
ncbi:unnamed protein product [Urochloa decumbens]|uniref:FAS1 domain-containing protein n=1 Tax=Urochloa decumbens TaxID=240449 RepID=A0ABC9DY23_9POAL